MEKIKFSSCIPLCLSERKAVKNKQPCQKAAVWMSEIGRAINVLLWGESDPMLCSSRFHLAFRIIEHTEVSRIRTVIYLI